jgi:hypothetical protein
MISQTPSQLDLNSSIIDTDKSHLRYVSGKHKKTRTELQNDKYPIVSNFSVQE